MPPANRSWAVLSARADASESELIESAKSDMLCGMFEPIDNIDKRFKGNPEGAELGMLIRSYYYQGMGLSIPLYVNAEPKGDALDPASGLITPFGIITCRRAPDNSDRDSDVKAQGLKDTMKKEGYDSTKRSPPMVKRVPAEFRWCDSEHCYWVYGAASCDALGAPPMWTTVPLGSQCFFLKRTSSMSGERSDLEYQSTSSALLLKVRPLSRH